MPMSREIAAIAPVTLTGKMLADFLVGDLADLFEQLTVAAVDFGFLSDFKQPLGARIALV